MLLPKIYATDDLFSCSGPFQLLKRRPLAYVLPYPERRKVAKITLAPAISPSKTRKPSLRCKNCDEVRRSLKKHQTNKKTFDVEQKKEQLTRRPETASVLGKLTKMGNKLTREELELLGMKEESSSNWICSTKIEGMDPERTKITLDERKRTVLLEGSAEWKSNDESSFSSTTFSRILRVPGDVKLESLASKMLPSGKLVLVAERNINEKLSSQIEKETSEIAKKTPAWGSETLAANDSDRRSDENKNSEETNEKQMDTDGSPNLKGSRENESSSEDEEKDNEEEDRDVIPLFTVDDSISDEANGGEVAEVEMAENEEADRESASGHTWLDVEDKDVSETTAMKTNELELAKEPSLVEIILIKKPIGNEWPNLS